VPPPPAPTLGGTGCTHIGSQVCTCARVELRSVTRREPELCVSVYLYRTCAVRAWQLVRYSLVVLSRCSNFFNIIILYRSQSLLCDM
jgi:hypothetical protein